MNVFTAKNGRRYFKDSYGCFRECNESPDLGVPSSAQVQDTRPSVSYSGIERGNYGNTQPNAVDDAAYIRKHFPSGRGIDGEAVEHAGSPNHPLNNMHTSQPFRPTRLPEDVVAEQNAVAAAEIAAAEEEKSND